MNLLQPKKKTKSKHWSFDSLFLASETTVSTVFFSVLSFFSRRIFFLLWQKISIWKCDFFAIWNNNQLILSLFPSTYPKSKHQNIEVLIYFVLVRFNLIWFLFICFVCETGAVSLSVFTVFSSIFFWFQMSYLTNVCQHTYSHMTQLRYF